MWLFALFLEVFFGMLGGSITSDKGYSYGLGFFLGLTWVGFIIILFLPKKTGMPSESDEIEKIDVSFKKPVLKRCVICNRKIAINLKSCPHCDSKF